MIGLDFLVCLAVDLLVCCLERERDFALLSVSRSSIQKNADITKVGPVHCMASGT